jgi:hypothetical protein
LGVLIFSWSKKIRSLFLEGTSVLDLLLSDPCFFFFGTGFFFCSRVKF